MLISLPILLSTSILSILTPNVVSLSLSLIFCFQNKFVGVEPVRSGEADPYYIKYQLLDDGMTHLFPYLLSYTYSLSSSLSRKGTVLELKQLNERSNYKIVGSMFYFLFFQQTYCSSLILFFFWLRDKKAN